MMHAFPLSAIVLPLLFMQMISATEPLSAASSEYTRGYSDQVNSCFSYVLPACSPHYKYTRCRCDKAPSYNVSQISSNVEDLVIGKSLKNRYCEPSCLLSTFVPLPALPRVYRVSLFNLWVAPDDQPFPVQRFLVNVKSQLTSLRLWEIYLPVLTRDTLAGFARLARVDLQRNRLSSIAVDAFAALTPLSGQLSAPQLSKVWINENNLTRLDWSMWNPVADSLTGIDLEANEIREIYLSNSFVLPHLKTLYLPGNQLESVSDDFLASLSSPAGRPFLRLEYNRLCLDDAKCGCSSMSNLWEWYLQRTLLPYPDPNKYYPFLLPDALTCGNYTVDEPWKHDYVMDKFQPIENVTRIYRSYLLLAKAQLRSGKPLTESWLPSVSELVSYLSGDDNFDVHNRVNASVAAV